MPRGGEVKLDTKDRVILRHLMENSRAPLKELARIAGVSIATVKRRMRKLNEIIRRYTILVDPKYLNRPILAFLMISAKTSEEKQIRERIKQWKEVCEIHEVSGSHGLLLKVRARDKESLSHLKGKLSAYFPEAKIEVVEVTKTWKEVPLEF